MSTTIEPTAPEAVKSDEPKKRKRKPIYEVAEGVQLEDTPEDFNPSTHRILAASFKDKAFFLEHRARMKDLEAASLRKQAEEWRLNPTASTSEKKAKLVKRLALLEAKLSEMGVNLDDLFADDE